MLHRLMLKYFSVGIIGLTVFGVALYYYVMHGPAALTVTIPAEFCHSWPTGRTSVVTDMNCIPTAGANGQLNACGMMQPSTRTVSERQVQCNYSTWE